MLCELFYGIAVWRKIRMPGMYTSSISTSIGLPQRHLSITGFTVVVINIIICGYFFCTHVCVPHASLVHTEAGKGLCIPWNWRYRWWWATTQVLGSEFLSSGEIKSNLLTIDPFLHPGISDFIFSRQSKPFIQWTSLTSLLHSTM